MSAQPVHEEPDPRDPEVILARLPEREREGFLAQYHEAAQAAVGDVAEYKRLKFVVNSWSARASAVSRPGYYEAIEDAKNETGEAVSIQEAMAQIRGIPLEEAEAEWDGLVEAARQRRQAG